MSLLMISKLFVLYPQEWLLTQTAELRQLFLGASAWLETGITQAVAGYHLRQIIIETVFAKILK